MTPDWIETIDAGFLRAVGDEIRRYQEEHGKLPGVIEVSAYQLRAAGFPETPARLFGIPVRVLHD